ncbi:lactadherin-like [Lingula anatina]|uniref:Lactadherin-like n=1 Tax=Lingula anatina TaxID=7574 RepID=A0A1S3JZV9_LINAN|nr:lactadherin-like [Lingula anatina]|eukprot:XP_013415930.1 lactadherin-like [Lingula anatina]
MERVTKVVFCFPLWFFLTFFVHVACSTVDDNNASDHSRQSAAIAKLHEVRILNRALLKGIGERCPDVLATLESNLHFNKRETPKISFSRDFLLKVAVDTFYELLGLYNSCLLTKCNRRLVFGRDPLPKKAITASSSYSGFSPYGAKLNHTGHTAAWAAATSNKNQWLQFDLGTSRVITAVLTRGRDIHNQWVTEYKLQYSSSGSKWTTYQDQDGKDKLFSGNSDHDTIVRQDLVPRIQARFVRILPMKWHHHISLRADILGC